MATPTDPTNLPGGSVPILGTTVTIPKDMVEVVMTTLNNAFMHLKAVDESNAVANLAELRPRPLTMQVASTAAMFAEATGLVEAEQQEGLVTL